MKSKGRWRGVLWVITGLLVLGIISFSSRTPKGTQQILDQLRADGYPITWEDLNAFYPQAPHDENAAVPLEEAQGLYKRPRDDVPRVGINAHPLKRGEAWSDTSKLAAREFLHSNAEVRSLLTVATQKSGSSRFPLDITEGNDLKIPHLSYMKAFAYMLSVEAELAMEEYRPGDAGRALLDGFIIADCLQHEPLSLSQIVRIASLAIYATSLERILNRGFLNDTDLMQLQERFSQGRDVTMFMYDDIIGQFTDALPIFHVSTDKLSGAIEVLKAAPSVIERVALWAYGALGFRAADEAYYVGYLDRIMRSSELNGLKRIEALREIESEMATTLNPAFPLNRLISKSLIPSSFFGVFRIAEEDLRRQTALRLAELSCALERYRAHHDNALPTALADLVPDYINAIPEDPWDGMPLRYRPLVDTPGYMLYSVGENQTDDGGLVRLEGVKIDPVMIKDTWVVAR